MRPKLTKPLFIRAAAGWWRGHDPEGRKNRAALQLHAVTPNTCRCDCPANYKGRRGGAFSEGGVKPTRGETLITDTFNDRLPDCADCTARTAVNREHIGAEAARPAAPRHRQAGKSQGCWEGRAQVYRPPSSTRWIFRI
ncbi:hypothetical protein EYF80_014939 [Liparis tanakae]|uniref:Uncharacterized protein n=1 Tax=Liparis tanakae TaxID=230148 RepID=A0A4Z2I9S4_9TELE|nr:hypothetical protein EYF80_014939 [Liparis tanakae]